MIDLYKVYNDIFDRFCEKIQIRFIQYGDRNIECDCNKSIYLPKKEIIIENIDTMTFEEITNAISFQIKLESRSINVIYNNYDISLRVVIDNMREKNNKIIFDIGVCGIGNSCISK